MTRWILLFFTFIFTTFDVGCGKVASSSSEDARQFKAVGVLYGQYLSSHAGKSPASEEDLKGFVESTGAGTLKRFGLKNAEELFFSPRDKQPLIWIFQGTSTDRIIAYEKEGIGGSRVVVTALGSVEELDAEEFHSRVN